jgi:hypothetical protein
MKATLHVEITMKNKNEPHSGKLKSLFGSNPSASRGLSDKKKTPQYIVMTCVIRDIPSISFSFLTANGLLL